MTNFKSTMLIFFVILFFGWQLSAQSPVTINDIPKLSFKTGDIIGISEARYDSATLFFEAATGTRYGHIGVVGVENGTAYVYEGAPPRARRTTVSEFLERSANADKQLQFTTVRPKNGVTAEQEGLLFKNMDTMVKNKIPYNPSMKMNPDSVNCSEFVNRAYANTGIPGIGTVEQMSQQNVNAFGGKLLELYNRSNAYDPGAKVLTPASIIQSPDVQIVTSTLPHDRIMSDKELFKAWEKDGSAKTFSRDFGIPEEQLKMMGELASNKPFKVIGQTPPATTTTTTQNSEPAKIEPAKNEIPPSVKTVVDKIKKQPSKPDFYQVEINGTKVFINQAMIDELAKSKNLKIEFIDNWDEADTKNISPRVPKDPSKTMEVFRGDIEDFFRSADVNKFKIKSLLVDGKELFTSEWLSAMKGLSSEAQKSAKGSPQISEAEVRKIAIESKGDLAKFEKRVSDKGLKGGSLAVALAFFTSYYALSKAGEAQAAEELMMKAQDKLPKRINESGAQ